MTVHVHCNQTMFDWFAVQMTAMYIGGRSTEALIIVLCAYRSATQVDSTVSDGLKPSTIGECTKERGDKTDRWGEWTNPGNDADGDV